MILLKKDIIKRKKLQDELKEIASSTSSCSMNSRDRVISPQSSSASKIASMVRHKSTTIIVWPWETI